MSNKSEPNNTFGVDLSQLPSAVTGPVKNGNLIDQAIELPGKIIEEGIKIATTIATAPGKIAGAIAAAPYAGMGGEAVKVFNQLDSGKTGQLAQVASGVMKSGFMNEQSPTGLVNPRALNGLESPRPSPLQQQGQDDELDIKNKFGL